MKEILIITSGLLGSSITIVAQAIINAYNSKAKHKREIQCLVFKRKTKIVEQAVSWYQEAIDTLLSLQMALRAYDNECNPITIERIHYFSKKSMNLYNEANSRLNSIYLYYNFSKIEDRYNGKESMELINKVCTIITKIDYEIYNSKPLEYAVQICEALNKLKIDSFKMLADLFENQICILAQIQNNLREEYNNYLK